MKPTTPLLAPDTGPLKPASPLRPKTAPKTPISHPQRRRRFQTTGPPDQQGLAAAPVGGGGAWSGDQWAPTLQTSSNQRNSNRHARTPVTNVVNLSKKISVFNEKAVGLTTFVTTTQECAQKTPWIDDVCNNTHQTSPKPSMRDPRNAHRQRRGLAAAPAGGDDTTASQVSHVIYLGHF